MSFVDLMSNVTYTPLQISKRLQEMEEQVYTKRSESVLNRIGTGVSLGKRPQIPEEAAAMDNFNTFMSGMETEADNARADNQLLKETLSYEASEQRLSQYVLLEGQVGVEAAEATYDPETGEELTPEIIYVPHFDPLPEFVTTPIYDEDGFQTGTEEIRNPIIIRDEAERLAAQTTIDSARQEVLDLAVLRRN